MSILKNVSALVAGFATVALLSMATDSVFIRIGIFPEQSQGVPYVSSLLIIALLYRTLFTVVGGYVTARLAPEKPMRLVYILGVLGTLAAIGGVIVGWNLSAHWYPIALAVLAFPSVALGGWIFERSSRGKVSGMRHASSAAPEQKKEITITRIFDANRQRVWEMWTKPEKLCLWFGVPPLSATADTTSIDLHVGGEWHADMVNTDNGAKLQFGGKYLEIDSPRKLVFTLEDGSAKTRDAETVTVTFTDRVGTTEMTMHQTGNLPQDQYGEPLRNGYNAFFDRMGKYLITHL